MTTPYTRFSREQLFQNRVFKTVRRVGLPSDLAGGVDFNIFNVSAPILVQYIFGHVTTAIGAGAAVPRIQFTPTGGAQVPLCAAAAAINGDAVNTIYTWSGLIAGALTPSAQIGAADLAATAQWSGGMLILVGGIIAVTNAVASTGIIDWYISYLPLEDTTIVTAL